MFFQLNNQIKEMRVNHFGRFLCMVVQEFA
jgi:hypothetical protein